ncbi:MAG: cysteine rich repeat-containing protein, partial [Gammaproteobacteria bacterium]|nr:cysteine rich repeat-containing protein [Gammaproteobacteria bacterium]
TAACMAAPIEPIVETVAQGCEKELQSYCAKVTPGEGRVLACLYAHEDKLSGRCEYALYDAAAQLERAIAALTFVANECDDDLEKHCATVAAGEGRLAECLLKNKVKLTKRCAQAMEDTGL